MLSNLILKDFIITKKLWIILPIYAIFFKFANTSFSPIHFLIPFFTYMFILQAVAYDDKNNSNTLLASFPIKKHYLVLSKYLSYIAFSIIILAIILIINLIFNLCTIKIIEILFSLFLLSIILDIYLPIYFKFGYIKSKYFNLSVFALIFVAASLNTLNKLENSNSGPPEFITILFNYLTSISEFKLSTYIIVLFILINFISYFISNSLFKSRDL
jgi:hypothetical protein